MYGYIHVCIYRYIYLFIYMYIYTYRCLVGCTSQYILVYGYIHIRKQNRDSNLDAATQPIGTYLYVCM